MVPDPATAKSPTIPLVVDLDGTLLHTDMLHESALVLMKNAPLALLQVPAWLAQGKAVLKRRLAERVRIDATTLPYNEALLEWLRSEQATGRSLTLCTASDASIAESIAAHLGLFGTVMGSDGQSNLSGRNKAERLDAAYGRGGYDYAGNSTKDLAVWKHARRAIVVNAADDLPAKVEAPGGIERVFPRRRIGVGAWGRVLRVHQWLKNVLLFVPLLAAHAITDFAVWPSMLVALASFSLCASSVYIANDLLDLESDRQHPRKRFRPFASGLVPASYGVVLAPLLLIVALALAAIVNHVFFAWLVCYFVVTCTYSWMLKRQPIVDCLTLAMLYTLRIIAGAAAASLALSFWLLAFAVFLFLSLAFVKRYAELELQSAHGRQKAHGRGYYTTDAPLVQSLGVTSGYASVVVLALYLNSDKIIELYRAPEVIWGTVPVLLFWIGWMWMQAHRGKMHDDPLVFAVKDQASQLAGLVFGIVLVIGAVGWPW